MRGTRGILVVTGIFLASSAQGETTPFFVSDSLNRLMRVDVSTGWADLVGGTLAQFTDIAFDTEGRLFGITRTYLYEIDPETAWSTLIGPHGFSGPYGIDALTFGDDGVLYGAGDDVLISIDTRTGAGAYIGHLSGYRSAGDLAGDGPDQLLLTTDAGVLVEVSASGTGARPIGELPFDDIFALGRRDGGDLYGIRATNDLLSIDPATGRATVIGPLQANFTLGYAWGGSFPYQAAPDAPTALLCLSGALVMILRPRGL